ncbi:MurR/RpiR family transcriptional regulator [Romboutsia sp. 1001713B170207_170306_H8]|uniref:MurR/RpiR family transcriptional regulator n=1 Tax=Romboutsia sp. 1001713B170207_170306_H8 TaxID=2787112 RepID=UPI00082055E0|nr:MurR/RpiR family transcriptional regulator [Romboutsia sp. 1001713B170207_170306_H8]SCH87672.1 Uncharacterized HTH-type transcriptional regulator ybbH [uncultured Clostridium sp.]
MDIRLETLIYDNYKKLNENDKHIWNYILNNKSKCESMSIQELASNCNVSHTTILRFAQKIGLNGYSELKFYLKLENNKKCTFDKGEIISISDDINKTIDLLIQRDFSDICYLLDSCKNIYAYGTGEIQSNAVRELKRNLLSIGKLVNIVEGNDEVETITNYITEDDMIFLISLSGENNTVNKFAKDLNNKGVKIISITESGNNTLSKISDINIQFYTHEVIRLEDNLQIFSASQFFIINEFLLVKYLEYKYSK